MLNQGSGCGGLASIPYFDQMLATIPNTEYVPSGPVGRAFPDVTEEFPATVESNDGSLEWAATNFPDLLGKYRGEWILVKNCKVVDHSIAPVELLKRATERGVKRPLMLRIGQPPTARRAAFVAHGG